MPADELFGVSASYSHGHVLAVLTAIKKLDFARLISSRPSRERDLILAMVVSRILKPFSKLATTRWLEDTTLPMELPNIKNTTANDLYGAMDWLLAKQNLIEQKLAKRHLKKNGLVLYDLSSSYMEGDCCELARYGYSRDKKRGKKQVNYGLLTNKQGCPVSVEVFPGDTKDCATVLEQTEKIRNRFNIDQMVLIGDRGMITQGHIDLFKDTKNINWITALKNRQVQVLFENEAIELGWFADKHLLEITYQDESALKITQSEPSERTIRLVKKTTVFLYKTNHKYRYLIAFPDEARLPIKRVLSPDNKKKIYELLRIKTLASHKFTEEEKDKIFRNISCFRKHVNINYVGERLIVCYNKQLAKKRQYDRQALIAKTEKALQDIQSKIQNGKIEGKDAIGLRIGKCINKFKVAKLFNLDIKENNFTFQINQSTLKAERETDGIYAIRTGLSKDKMNEAEVVRSYKDLTKVERAFRSLKSISLKVRPIYHYADNRVKAHIFLCMLAYYVEWHMREAWRTLLFSDEEIELKRSRDPVIPSKPSDNAKVKAESKLIADGSAAHSFQSLLQHLGTIVRNNCHYKKARTKSCFTIDTTPNAKQTKALQLLETINVPSSV
jgi:transposase